MVLVGACFCPAQAQDAVATFYKGKTVDIVIASDAGGGYDTYGRLIGRYIGSHIPGNPTVVPQNMPGAGGATADLNTIGVPLTVDFAKTPEQRQALDLVYSQEVFGRPYIMAAEVPKERVEAIRKAFMDTFKDPAFLAEAGRMKLDVVPLSGEEVQAVVAKAFATPPSVIDLARSAIAPPT